MSTSEQHYESLLASVYSWMAGGAQHAFEVGAQDLEGHLPEGKRAVDLGCGFGMHTIPLARAGRTVLAVDSSATLVSELQQHANGLPVRGVVADLLDFPRHLEADDKPQLILCMGDTLTHLPDWQSVTALAEQVARVLAAGGRFIATFRDYTTLPEGPRRFIPVRSDAERILTCFLEAHPNHVEVHDLLYAKSADGWKLSVSSYSKLRLDPAEVQRAFANVGLRAVISSAPRGMVRLIADA